MHVLRFSGWALCASVALTLLTSAPTAAANAAPLVVCADPDFMPYSDRAGAGFENELARVVGHALARPVEFYFRSMRAKDEYGEYLLATIQSKKCDVLVDVPYALQQVKTTRPYFTASYVFVTKKSRRLGVTSLDSPALQHLKIGYEGDTPVQLGLKARTLLGHSKLFITADEEGSSPSAIIDAVEAGKIDVAMTWDPAVGYFLKQHSDLVATIIPNSRSQGSPEQYSFPMAMATRTGDARLNAQLGSVLAAHASELQAVLRRYNILFNTVGDVSS